MYVVMDGTMCLIRHMSVVPVKYVAEGKESLYHSSLCRAGLPSVADVKYVDSCSNICKDSRLVKQALQCFAT